MSKKSFTLIALQLLAMLYLAGTYTMSQHLVILGLQAISILITLWAISAGGVFNFNIQPEVKSDTLITKPPFSLIRNPMYLGLLLFFGTDLLSNFTLIRCLAFVILVIVLLLKIFSEEKFLQAKFGNAYEDYKTKSYRLLPFIY